jgi:hypothetical protein
MKHMCFVLVTGNQYSNLWSFLRSASSPHTHAVRIPKLQQILPMIVLSLAEKCLQ